MGLGCVTFCRAAEGVRRVGTQSDVDPPGSTNATATGNCFKENMANWKIWCGKLACMNEKKWLSSKGGNFNGTCG